ncbi:MAG: hypothetical protein J6G98_01015 [Bacilli bacterium]|nr:hypothetical protein [Bacilli bacterium]
MKKWLKYILITSIFMFIGMSSSMALTPKFTCTYNVKVDDLKIGASGSKKYVVSVYNETTATSNVSVGETIDDSGNLYVAFNGGEKSFHKQFAKAATDGNLCPVIKISSYNSSDIQFNLIGHDTTGQASKEYEGTIKIMSKEVKVETENEVCSFTTQEIKSQSASITVHFYNQGSKKLWAIYKNMDGQDPRLIDKTDYNKSIVDGEYSYRVSESDYDNFWTNGKCDKIGHYVQSSNGGLFTIQSEKPSDAENGEAGSTVTPTEKPDSPQVVNFGGCADMPKTTELLRQVYRLVRYLIPVLIIVLSIVDFIKVVANGDDKEYKNAWNKFIKRIIIGIVIIIVPTIISMLIGLSGLDTAYGIKDIICVIK